MQTKFLCLLLFLLTSIGLISGCQYSSNKSMEIAPVAMMVSIPPNTEKYQALQNNPIKSTQQEPVSTFSIDVDTGAYSNMRRFLSQGQLPPKDAIRIEELINYFSYTKLNRKDDHPFGVNTEIAPAPWNQEHHLLRIQIQAMETQALHLPPSNLVFLVDVSGSMADTDKLPLVKNILKMLATKLREQDRISLVVYAGRTQVELESTPGNKHSTILAAIDRLQAEGSTDGESALKLAYEMARKSYIPGGINRILLATDGDFNVGVSDVSQLKNMIETERKSGVSLSTLGFGQGNYNEYLMEQIADIGNGNHSYIDSADEGRKVLIDEMASTFNTVAADVKIQIEFNPAQIAEYRLIGYENRMLNEADFNNDNVDAGEIGAGKTVTAIYELTPIGKKTFVDPHRYAQQTTKTESFNNELGFLKIRYKKPYQENSIVLQEPVLTNQIKNEKNVSQDFMFTASVAAFGQLLKNNANITYDYDRVINLAKSGTGEDTEGYRAEFIRLVKIAKELDQTTRI